MPKRRNRNRKRDKLLGAPAALGEMPGQLMPPANASPPEIERFAYNSVELVEEKLEDGSNGRSTVDRFPVTWINVDGMGEPAIVSALGTQFNFHRLALEDVVHGNQRAKVELYGDHYFIVTQMLLLTERGLDTEQFSLFLGRNYVITFQEQPGDCFKPVRDRIRNNRGRIRVAGPDYLAYALLDTMIDAYFPVLEQYGEKLDALEDEIVSGYRPESISTILEVKRDLLTMRRAVWPLREVLNTLVRDPNPLIADETRVHLRDCYDHTVRVIDLIENYRELSADMMSLYLSIASTRMNEIMKVLTIISTIFMPLTFIAGIYGMNFRFMPELNWELGYPLVMAVMAVITLLMLRYFRHRGWMGPASSDPLSVLNHSDHVPPRRDGPVLPTSGSRPGR